MINVCEGRMVLDESFPTDAVLTPGGNVSIGSA